MFNLFLFKRYLEKLHVQILFSATFTADDVLREFRTTKEKRSNRKLLKILEIISKNQAKCGEHLVEAAKLLEKYILIILNWVAGATYIIKCTFFSSLRKDPFYCLLNFLNHYSDTNIMQSIRKKDISTSTPLINKKMFETVTPDCVSEVYDRTINNNFLLS